MKLNLNLSVYNRLAKRYPIKWVALLIILTTILIMKACGAFTCLFHRDYFTEFSYPLEGDIVKFVKQIRSGQMPQVAPINAYNYPFLMHNKTKCINSRSGKSEAIRLLIVIKSALLHRGNRGAIRRTWGRENQIPSGLNTRTVFLVGTADRPQHLQQQVMREHEKYGDIIQSDFIDTYFNNTVKTMQGILWTIENCPGAEYILFSDDDMYVSVKNILSFIRDPENYPFESTQIAMPKQNWTNHRPILFGGSVFLVSPVRSQFSKWYMSLDEYPYDHYPPFINAGAFVLSNEALVQLFYSAMYTKHLRFDDVFLGIAAKKVHIELTHSEHFYNWKKGYSKAIYKNVIAAHGYDDPMELQHVWNEQKDLGNA